MAIITEQEHFVALERKVDDLNLYVRKIIVKLFGDDEDENKRGRLPLLEAVSEDHDRRIRRLENIVIRGGGVLGALWFLVSLALKVLAAVQH